jgi:hypothetical protein
MRPIVLGLVLAACSLPAFAAEPDGPGELITKTEAVRIAVQNKLSPKSPTARKNEQAALVEYYAVPDQPLIWVDDKGLNERAKLAMAEIAKADDYGLKASDYALPKADGFDPKDPKATDWLADAEVKLSYAVLDYANECARRAHRPAALERESRSDAHPARSIRGDCLDRLPLRSRGLSPQLPARPAAIRGAPAKIARAARRQAGRDRRSPM